MLPLYSEKKDFTYPTSLTEALGVKQATTYAVERFTQIHETDTTLATEEYLSTKHSFNQFASVKRNPNCF